MILLNKKSIILKVFGEPWTLIILLDISERHLITLEITLLQYLVAMG